MTPKLMKKIASITTGCFVQRDTDLEVYAAPIYFADRGGRKGEKSGFYLLRPQYECLYSAEMGLQFPEKVPGVEDLLYF